MKFSKSFALMTGALLALSGTAFAMDNLEKLKNVKVTGISLDIPTIPQEGRNADAIRANLENVKLPSGFNIELYAIVPDAREMAVGLATNMVFVGTRKTSVWAVTDRNGDQRSRIKFH
jgi:hypothetical protein